MGEAKIKISSEFDSKGVESAKKGVDGLAKGAQAAQAPMSGFGNIAKGVFAGMMSWELAMRVIDGVFNAVKNFAIGSLKAWGDQEAASNKLAQSLKNQGIYSAETAKDLEDYASSLQKTSVFGDEVITGVMSSLTAFGLQGDELKEVTKATLDLAQATGMDLNTAGMLIAKSVGSSTNALARYGIEIDTSSSKTEKAKQIVEGISAVYGGQATAATQTFEGKQKQLANTFGDLQELVGQQLSPAVGGFLEIMVEGATHLVNFSLAVIDNVKAIWNFFAAVDNATGIFSTFGKAVVDTIQKGMKPLLAILDLIGKAWGWLREKMDGFTKEHAKATEEVVRDEEKQRQAVKTTTTVTASELDKQVADKKKALDEKSKAAKKHWDNELDLASKDLKEQKKLLEQAVQDKRLQTAELEALQHKLRKTLKEIKDQEVADAKKADDEKAASADKTAELMAQTFRATATGTQDAWDKLAQGMTDTLVKNAFTPMASGLNSMLGGFGDIGTMLAGGVGGVIGSVVGGFLGMLGTNAKSVAEYTKESYDDMVEHTNDAIKNIGKERSETQTKLDLLEKLKGTEGALDTSGKFISSEASRFLGVAGMSYAEAQGMLLDKLAADTSGIVETRQAAIREAEAELEAAKAREQELRDSAGDYWLHMDTYWNELNAALGRQEAAKQIIEEQRAAMFEAQADIIKTNLDVEKKKSEAAIVIPSAATGGYVQKGGLVNIHSGEHIVPAGKGGGGTFNFTINGVNFANEEQKKAVAKQLAAYIMKYTNGDARLPAGAERRL